MAHPPPGRRPEEGAAPRGAAPPRPPPAKRPPPPPPGRRPEEGAAARRPSWPCRTLAKGRAAARLGSVFTVVSCSSLVEPLAGLAPLLACLPHRWAPICAGRRTAKANL